MAHRRESTPPTLVTLYDPQGLKCPLDTANTTLSYYPQPQTWSPLSSTTSSTSPPRSPQRIRDRGPLLLPRVRTQDQIVGTETSAAHLYYHHRTAPLPADARNAYLGNHQGAQPYPSSYNYSRSPSNLSDHQPSLSPLDHMVQRASSVSRKPTVNHARDVSVSTARGHTRNVSSSSSIDASTLSRYGYPTYRHTPVPQLAAGHTYPPVRTSTAMSHLAPVSNTEPRYQPQLVQTAQAVQTPSPETISSVNKVVYEQLVEERITALEYLTSPNPTPSLTRRTVDAVRGQNMYFWYDVRNVRVWNDFHISTIAAIPDLMRLLQFPVTASVLPVPGRVNLNPETLAQLAEIGASHHAVKVNAVLKLVQGNQKHMAMRALRSVPGARQQPEFVSSYQSDTEHTIYGDNRGRVIGIVKSYEQWNSGMRSGEAPEKVKYLQGLAHLHHFMREHGTRYGFIMTEIELVCVRAGGPPSPASNVPLFGYLEVAMPVDMSSFGLGDNASVKMTVGLALWWIHMLAKERPMPGQFHWRMEVGAASARTRSFHLARDDWMPRAIGMDTREAKRVRGWVWPNEPLSKRECGKIRKSKK